MDKVFSNGHKKTLLEVPAVNYTHWVLKGDLK